MEFIYYYFLRRSIDNTLLSDPFVTKEYLGDIGEFCEIDGVGYVIEDYAEELTHEQP